MIFLSYDDAKKSIHKLNFKTVTEWLNYTKSGKRPFNIPSTPRRTYKNEWKGMGDWLGTEIIPTQKRVYKKFEDARKFVRKLKLKNRDAWTKYCKSGDKPNDIPNNPWHQYRNSGWKGMGDWLGTGTVASFNKHFLPFKEAREFTKKLGLKNSAEWREYCKSGNRPDDIHSAPSKIYKNEWKGMGDWLGTGTIADKNKKRLTYDDAKKFVHKLHLSGATAWREYIKSGKLQGNIPTNPNNTYKKQGTWVDWGDFLGTNNVSVTIKSKSFLSAKEAKPVYQKLFKEHGIKNGMDWKRFAKAHKKLLEELYLPADVLVFYNLEKANAEKRKKQK
jgi:hypothetical protein